MNKVLYLDVETSGLFELIHGIISIGYIVEIDGDVKEEGVINLNPMTYNKPKKVSEEALRVNGTSIDDLKSYSTSVEVFVEFQSILKKYVDPLIKGDRFVLVGYNVDFDFKFLRHWFKDNNPSDKHIRRLGAFVHYKYVCIFNVVKWLIFIGKIDIAGLSKAATLEIICGYFNIDIKAHNALSDVKATRELHLILKRHLINLPKLERRYK